jgi:hypothetical protein
MSAIVELNCIHEERLPEINPNGIIVNFAVHCPQNAIQVLERSKEVLEAVITNTSNPFPSDTEWGSILPNWFVEECNNEVKQKHNVEQIRQSDIWTVSNWIYWFRSENRYWFWWDAVIISDKLIELDLDAKELVFPWAALEWLFLASGASGTTEI